MKEMTRIRHRRRAARAAWPACVVTCLCLAGPAAFAQSFNIDFDSPGAPPELGGGAPSAAFGAAAGQPGYWNPVWSPYSWNLRDILGRETDVLLITSSLQRTRGSWNFPGNTGDYAKLLNDGEGTNPVGLLTFTGLLAGQYTVTTYSVFPDWEWQAPTLISVQGAPPEENPQRVIGPMPGNDFAYLVTHSIHHATVTNGELVIDFRADPAGRGSMVNGLQISYVPEPATLIGLTSGLAVLVSLRRRGGRAVSGG
ncbi:PEP-CTERM sorting domain-containing protein [Fimbriimonadia bacterium ATM]|nr:MAG: PEP-CTERM sorting domain-containing protein [Armatimonadota bacterium]MBC6970819.1 PEP-CTERM sorting domain-containing protein [Armatimonadota bacterium]MCE7900995.1 PEP-CTERM sorting domain-containing protein [Armatimonadetes bacterium ATM1]MDL1929228.1 PEP-CTERM sorting domain-containing protein [Fimbriimonadia bacterium ATM]RIJ94578.1 MAG: hypothetical protein DCC45_12245 [Armatimonadota bacterium]